MENAAQKYGRWNPVPKELEDVAISYYQDGNSAHATSKKFGISFDKVAKRRGLNIRPKKSYLTDNSKRDAEIISLYKNGISTPKISEKTGVSTTRISNILKENGVATRSQKDHRPKSAGKENAIIAAYNSGMSASDTCEQFGVCESTVLYVLRQAGQTVRRVGIHDVTKSHLWKGGVSKNKEYMNKKRNDYRVERRKNDPLYKLTHTLRSRVLVAFKRKSIKKTSKSYEILGADWATIKLHIESKFREGMTWKNHGYGEDKWHVDHIVPIAFARNEEELVALMHYTNLQPLWQKENQSKGGRYASC